MSSLDSPGRAASPQMPAESTQHRGKPMYTKEELRKMFPPIKVGCINPGLRAILPHEYRCSSNTLEFRNLCNLCGLTKEAPRHRF